MFWDVKCEPKLNGKGKLPLTLCSVCSLGRNCVSQKEEFINCLTLLWYLVPSNIYPVDGKLCRLNTVIYNRLLVMCQDAARWIKYGTLSVQVGICLLCLDSWLLEGHDKETCWCKQMRTSWGQSVCSESVRFLLVKTSLLDVGHGQCTHVCLEKNGHIHMGKTQINKKKKKPGDFFFANII